MKSISRVRPLATPWTVAYQAPPSTGFPRQECWSGVPLPSPGLAWWTPIPSHSYSADLGLWLWCPCSQDTCCPLAVSTPTGSIPAVSPHQLFGIRFIYLFNRCSSQPMMCQHSPGTEMTEVKKYIMILVLGELIFKWRKQKVKKINRWNLPCVRRWWVTWRKIKLGTALLAVHFHLSHTGLGVGWTQHFSGNLFSHIGSLLALLNGTHSSTLAWKIPWMEEPRRLQSMGSLRVGHNWATSLSLFTFMNWRRKWQPTPVFLPGESQGWGSLVGCHLWGCTESDTTEVT